MTVIAALKANGLVYMGCDSLFMDVSEYQAVMRKQSKLIIKEEMIIGMTTGNGSRVFQTVKFKLKLPSTKKIKSEDLLEYLVVHFCSKLYKVLHAENMLEDDSDKKNSEPCLSPARMLIGIRNKLFEVGEDFDVAELEGSFFAIGSGANYALGALATTTKLIPERLDPEHHILHALKTSEHFTQSVRGPYHLIDTGGLCQLECS